MKLKNKTLLASALTGALAASASGASVALLDVANNRGTASAQNFINVGVSDIDASDDVTLGTVAGNTATFGTTGFTLTVDDASNMFTYPNSSWNGQPDISLMGDAWLYNQRGSTAIKNMTLSGLTANLSANTTYTLYFLGSYTGGEFAEFGDVTYGGNNLGDVVAPPADTANPSAMAQSITFTTGSVVENDLTFTFAKAADAAGNAAPIQGLAITTVIPEPSSSLMALVGVGGLALRRKRS